MRTMKDSGIEWIGEIPQEWTTIRTKYIASITNGSDPKTEGDTPVYGSGESSFKTCGEYKTGPAVLIGRKGATLHIPHYVEGYYWNVDTSFDVKIASDQFSLIYYYALAMCFDYKYYISTTTLPSMTQTNYGNMYLPFPSIDEQNRIISYLNDKCAEIDALIATKEKTNALLKEQRQSIIYEAVTKGLDPNIPLKDSGIEWLGQIPEKWTVWRMKHLAKEPLQYGANATGIEFDEGLPRYIRITDITSERKLADDGKQSLPIETAKDYMLEDGDILLARSGATAGKSYYYENSDGACCFAGYLIRFRANNAKANSKFLYYYTLTQPYEQWTQQIFIQATIQNISAEKYNNLCFAIPDTLEEQKRIVEYLDEKCAEIDSIITINNKTIQQLKKYHQSLIYEVVTGKKEV